jgi:hypothetical protein
MLKQLEKPKRQLVHHPCDALDNFCRYEATDRNWLDFDESVSLQLREFEFHNRQYIRQQPATGRRTTL